MSIKRYLEISYHFENDSNGVTDEFKSQFNLDRNFHIDELTIFLKIFFMKVPCIDEEELEKMLPYNMNEFHQGMEDEAYEEEVKKTFQSLYREANEISSDKENLKKFVDQINQDPKMLKKVFEVFIREMLNDEK